MADEPTAVRWLGDLTNDDVPQVGGKNASLGEMVQRLQEAGIRVPDGFATTAQAYRDFVEANDLRPTIRERIEDLHGGADLQDVGKAIRTAFSEGALPEQVASDVTDAYAELSQRYDEERTDVAARSSATAEDLPEASFAGQQETFLNVRGDERLLQAVLDCYASLFTDRAIAYREEHGFDHLDVALSVGIQKMVRSDRGGAGVAFTLDTETGFPGVVTIDAAWGLGESVVSGTVNPDGYTVFKPVLEDASARPIVTKERGDKATRIVYADDGGTEEVETTDDERHAFVLDDDEILQLARWCVAIEEHYDKPMDVEWAKDGDSGDLYVVQARPETVQSQREASALRTYRLRERGEVLVEGLAVGDAIAAGPVARLDSPDEGDRFQDGAVLVTAMTDPDWVPLMKRAGAVVTDHGGRTAHAAIVSRELGLPAVVGTGDATSALEDGQEVTVTCASSENGQVMAGILEFDEREVDLEDVPETDTRIMMNVASPMAAFRWWRLPARGIGLARIEFIVNNHVGVHPLALTRYQEVEDDDARERIDELARGYDDRTEYFVDRLARGVARIAASQHPEPVIVRMSDFKTNEYADLLGGAAFEPAEANPMLGFRGASRYHSDRYRDGFRLECRAMRRAREDIGLRNIELMLPFVRTVEEADRVLEVMADEGLERGRGGLRIHVMAEVPSNVILADRFAERFDGFSIGSNDLTQLVLGVDRDSDVLAPLFDERDDAVLEMMGRLIERARANDVYVGICGQAPSDHPEVAEFLVERGIDSLSLNPDSVLEAVEHVAETERRLRG